MTKRYKENRKNCSLLIPSVYYMMELTALWMIWIIGHTIFIVIGAPVYVGFALVVFLVITAGKKYIKFKAVLKRQSWHCKRR